MLGSIQDKLLRVRPPRVRITYDVETANAIEKKELPFIVGIFADLTGDTKDPSAPLPLVKDRKFVGIDRDNFDKVMEAAAPYVSVAKVPNVVGGSGMLSGGISFAQIADFEPLAIVMKVAEMRKLYEGRTRIRALIAKAESTDALARFLDDAIAFDAAGDAMRTKLVDSFVGKTPEQWSALDLPLLDTFLDAKHMNAAGAKRNRAVELLAQFVLDVVKPVQDRIAGRERLRALRALAKDKAALLGLLNGAPAKTTLATTFDPAKKPADWAVVDPALPANADAKALLDAMEAGDDADKKKYALTLLGEFVAAIDAEKKVKAALDPLVTALKAKPKLVQRLDTAVGGGGADDRKALLETFKPDAAPTAWGTADATKDGVVKDLLTLSETAEADKPKFLTALGFFTAQIVAALPANNGKAATVLIDERVRARDAIELMNMRILAGYPGTDPKLAEKQAAQDQLILGAAGLVDSRVADIDALLSKQLSLVMHCERFKQMEATWRGLHYLVSRSETGEWLKLRVLNVEKSELLTELKKAVEFDQSAVFKMIYEAEYDTFGGAPYSMLLGDYEFGRHPQDVELLNKIAEVAAAAHAPFISSAYAKLFDMESFESLARPRDLQKIFESDELVGWRAFRESEDSRYVTLTLPRALLRLPYGPDTVPAEGLNYEESVGTDASGADFLVPDGAKFLWGNPAYVLGERITNAFSLYGWTAAIRGVEGGGLVQGLPAYTFRSQDRDIRMICPTQVAITDRREKELNDLGFMAICHCKGTDKAAFFGGQTTNKPKKYILPLANSNAQVSSMLPYILAASRFAHYIKVIMRDKIGSFMTRGNVESFLNSWIAQYILLDDNATQEVKARFPLRQANVVVTDVPGKPGAYRATVFLKPHFQLEELTTSIRLVAELPS